MPAISSQTDFLQGQVAYLQSDRVAWPCGRNSSIVRWRYGLPSASRNIAAL